MNIQGIHRRRGAQAAVLLFLLVLAPSLFGSGVVTNCTFQELTNALAGGGTVTFECDGVIPMTRALVINTNVTFDARGRDVTLSGNSGTNPASGFRLFRVTTNVTFTLLNLTLTRGRSTNGGAILNEGGTLVASNCLFTFNEALGTNGFPGVNGRTNVTNGDDGGNGGNGVNAAGGAIFNTGTALVWRCVFLTNSAVGGDGGNGGKGGDGSGTGGDGGAGGRGGTALGGAIYNAGFLQARDTTFEDNLAFGGDGGAGGERGVAPFAGNLGNGGAGSAGAGAAIFNLNLRVADIERCTFSLNAATSGSSQDAGSFGSVGPNGARGPDSAGGGLCNLGTNRLVNCTFFANKANAGSGGNGGISANVGGDGGAGGSAWGGGFYNQGRAAVTNCTFTDGSATPGTNGLGGVAPVPGDPGAAGRSRGGNLANSNGVFSLKNTLIAIPVDGSTNGYTQGAGFSDAGFNLITDTSLPLTNPDSILVTDPLEIESLVEILADNGGPTFTIALPEGSRAIDAGDPDFCLDTDQRLAARGIGGICDIGAYEFGADAISPEFLLEPVGTNVLAGTTVTFSAIATGSPPVTLQWQLNGTNIPGATSTNLVLNNVQSTNAGVYTCEARNDFGTATSTNAVLTVRTPPFITTHPASQTVLVGTNVTFQVVAGGDAPLRFQWRFNGMNLSGATNTSYTKGNVQLGDSGTYDVTVSNSSGDTTSLPATLTVSSPPVITLNPTNRSVVESNATTFVVAATGQEPLRYQWQFNGANLTGETGTSLTLPAAQTNQTGGYQAIVTNVFGAATSTVAFLTVTPGTRIVTEPSGATNTQGGTATFQLVVAGLAPFTYQWFFAQVNAAGMTNIPAAPLAGATNASLVLTNIGLTNRGEYTVVVTGADGTLDTSLPAPLRVAPLILTNSWVDNVFTAVVPGEFGFVFFLEYANDLNSPVWTPLQDETGNGGPLTLLDVEATVPFRFYRVGVR